MVGYLFDKRLILL